ncbi:GH92 family glycosyl hydrolase [Streptomyces sp. NPDC059524]|uniref:GH92 family glycosyl hydrolase n=1 Tax=Streptomyces sp. NPDC059524 TaxID=3346856 RepID=UPI0036C98A66
MRLPRPVRLVRILSVLASAAVLISGTPATSTAASPTAGPSFPEDPTAYVNTSIGNNGSGTTFPGAALPFGMVQNSPDTRLNSYASYDYADSEILGFSQTHLSGVGCQTNGNIRLMPVPGAFPGTRPEQQAAGFSHADEKAEPGYYKVGLDNGVSAELTATARTGWQRYTFPANADRRTVVVNVGSSNGYTYAGHVDVVGDDTVEGWITGGNFCWETGKERYKVFFSAKFDRAFDTFGTWADGDDVASGRRSAAISGTPSDGSRADGGAMVGFSGGGQVGAAVGISYTSVDGARLNRRTESADQTFDSVRAAAHRTWARQLDRLQVAGGSEADRRTFYSSLYRATLHPSVGSDVDGRYMGFDKKVHRSDRPYYQMLSLWDTYRTQNQLVALLEPRRATDIAKSLLHVYQDGGWLPRWALASSETNVMSGEGPTPFITSLYARGLLDKPTARALFDALWKNVTQVPSDQSVFRGRDGNPTYTHNGWIGYQDKGGYTWGDSRQAGSATLEYALADCGLAGMAGGLGETAKEKTLRARCGNFADEWDFGVSSKGFDGFPRARTPQGTWAGSSDPTQSTGFHEGTAWQYQWLAQQDAPGLFALMGGKAKAQQRLDTFFDMPELLRDHTGVAKKSWVVGAYDYHNNFAFNPNNEPDLHAPWMYAWTDQPWKTSAVLRAAQPLFTDDAYGMPGNDDLGTLSSWSVWSMIGFYEVMPGSAEYVLSAPMFDRVRIQPDGGRPVDIVTPGADRSKLQYVSSVRVGDRAWTKSWIKHGDLLNAGTVRFALTSDPSSTDWGRGSDAQPPRHGTTDAGVRPYSSLPDASPALLAPGGNLKASVGAANLTGSRAEVAFTADASDGITVTPSSGRLSVDAGGRAATEVTVAAGDSAKPGLRTVEVTMTDTSTGEPLGSTFLSLKVTSLSYGKPATQRSTAWGGVAARAVDGNTDGNYTVGSVTHTAEDGSAEPWWQVDLGASRAISDVTVWNRTDCCSERLTDYYVLVSDTPFTGDSLAEALAQPGVTAVHRTDTAATPTEVPVRASGRYIRIQLATTTTLSLAEVEVNPS